MDCVTHSVMFHHFHNEQHLPSQGSLSSSEFVQMIDWLNTQYSILNASDYKKKLENFTLKETDICFSFDDALKCQFDIAYPVLERLGIESFFFVYSSVFSSKPDFLEIYRYFRTFCYENIDEFYEDFFGIVQSIDKDEYISQNAKYLNLNYLSACPFYSENDKWFRYIRDRYLIGNQYKDIMSKLMLKKDFDTDLAKQNLWMSENNLITLDSSGHSIGLHSYSHPTKISNLSKSEQKLEYQRNYKHLSELLSKSINSMSHPCGDYNKDTINILKEIPIEIGFRSNMSIKEIRSPLEIPRDDHTNIFKLMQR